MSLPISFNCMTDEILDSFLSLSRFTSLVRWQYVKESFRPVRSPNPPVDMALTSPVAQVYADDGMLWSAASDGAITVGWIVYDYDYDGRAEWEYDVNTQIAASALPRLSVKGLDTNEAPFELVWFDDRRGVIVEKISPLPLTGADAWVQVPGTEPDGGFGKSIAFLIQPVGYTPDRQWAELPNELIGQILIDVDDEDPIQLPSGWHEERPKVDSYKSPTYKKYRLVAHTRPEIPEEERNDYNYHWQLDAHAYYGGEPEGSSIYPVRFYFDWTHPDDPTFSKVVLEIKDLEGSRVCGDIIYAEVTP